MSRMAEQQLYIDGGYVSATSGKTFETINPANGEVLATVQAAGREDVDRAVKSAQKGQKIWAAMSAMERSRILRKAVDILRERNDELARLETLDTGKPLSETAAVDIVTGADVLEYYAGLIPALEGSQIPLRESSFVYTRRESFVMPMNITEFCSKLPTAHFFRCHRSYCVNLSKIREIEPWFNNTYVLRLRDLEFQVPVSRSKVKEFRQLMNL